METLTDTIYQVPKGEMNRIAGLFDGWQETMIWSCLQGHMGKAYAAGFQEAGESRPLSAAILTADFCFFAGVPHRELIQKVPEAHKEGIVILTAREPEWLQTIEEVWGKEAKKITRYGIKKDPGAFHPEKLKAYVNEIPRGYSLHSIDANLYEKAMAQKWSRDFCSSFESAEDFCRRGLGVAALYKGKLVAGASSYTIYDGGIEIEIDTEENHRRKGLALACGASLILKCLERGLYPSWDAHDLRSVSLAQKLGYEAEGPYTAYVIAFSKN